MSMVIKLLVVLKKNIIGIDMILSKNLKIKTGKIIIIKQKWLETGKELEEPRYRK